MRKLFYLILGGVLLGIGFTSCDDEPDNPGDFSITGTLGVMSITSNSGNTYGLEIAREFDSTITRYNVLLGTVVNPDGTETETKDTVWYTDGVCHYVKMKQVDLAPNADTITVVVSSNARWNAPQPTVKGRRWYAVMNGAGNGDGYLTVDILENTSATARTNVALQQIITSDSATIYEIPFGQLGSGN